MEERAPRAGDRPAASNEGGWEAIPQELLARILAAGPGDASAGGLTAARAACRAWRDAVDANLRALRPAAWPPGGPARATLAGTFPSLRDLDLSHLPPGEPDPEPAHPLCRALDAAGVVSAGAAGPSQQGGGAARAAGAGAGGASPRHYRHRSAGSLDLMGAAVLQSKLALDGAASLDAGVGDCLVSVVTCCRAGGAATATPATAYVASRWPEAVPHVTPMAALRLWREDLPQLHELRSLAVGGAMMLVQGVRTHVAEPQQQQQPLDAAAAAIAQLAGDEPAATVTHVYSLALPAAVCQLTGLRALSAEWMLPSGEPPAAAAAASPLQHGSIVLPNRRRSYEGTPSPTVVHVADPALRLPPQFSALANLQQLSLTASVSGADALRPLLGLTGLRSLALGRGELDAMALLPLADGGVLRQLTRLVLRQAGAWDAGALAAALAAMQQLEELVVEELEMSGTPSEAAISPEQRWTAAHVAPLASSLRSLSWATCTQRLASGASLLGRTPVASTDSPDAPGAWLGGLSALTRLRISGATGATALLGAPVLDALSDSVCSCSNLERLEVHGLGVPLLPGRLPQLQRLSAVSIASASMARRSLPAAESSLAVLGGCRALRRLALVGCELRHAPTWLGCMSRLTSLSLASNFLQDMPDGVPALGLPLGLVELDLSDNRLRELPAGVAELTALAVLRLDDNYLSSLPAEVWQLPALEELSAKENMLPELPELLPGGGGGGAAGGRPAAGGARPAAESSAAPATAAAATAAAAAAAQGEEPAAVPPAAPAAAGAPLSPEEQDAIAGTGVLLLPPPAPGLARAGSCVSSSRAAAASGARMCSSLKVLALAHNQLSSLPASIALLTSLKRLDLGHNQLRTLPEGGCLWALTRLTSLQLGHNHLRKLPASVSRLQQLVALDVSGNHLPPSLLPRPAAVAALEAAQHLPAPLRQLHQLRQLRLGGQVPEDHGPTHSPLQLVLGGLSDLVELLRSLAPPGHTCPVSKAAKAAVKHYRRMSSGSKRARREREAQLLQRVGLEPGWVVLPAPNKAAQGAAWAGQAPPPPQPAAAH